MSDDPPGFHAAGQAASLRKLFKIGQAPPVPKTPPPQPAPRPARRPIPKVST